MVLEGAQEDGVEAELEDPVDVEELVRPESAPLALDELVQIRLPVLGQVVLHPAQELPRLELPVGKGVGSGEEEASRFA